MSIKDSEEITRLFEEGRILQMVEYLKQNPDKVSNQMKEMIEDDYEFYKYGQSKIYKHPKTYNEIYKDKARGYTVRLNNDSQKGFLGYHATFNGKTVKYGSDEAGSIYFGNSGVENLIPYIMELDQMGSWTPHFRYVKQTKPINMTRMLIESIIDMPFPLSNRQSEMIFYIFNNI